MGKVRVKAGTKPPAKPGRPTDYSDALTQDICERIAAGESLVDVCAKEGMPVRWTVHRWLAEKPEFSDRYARAREEQAEKLAQEIVTIADEKVADSTGAARNRLRVDARKWVAAKLKPKVYGEKLDLTGDLGVTHSTDDDLRGALNGILSRLGVVPDAGAGAASSAEGATGGRGTG